MAVSPDAMTLDIPVYARINGQEIELGTLGVPVGIKYFLPGETPAKPEPRVFSSGDPEPEDSSIVLSGSGFRFTPALGYSGWDKHYSNGATYTYSWAHILSVYGPLVEVIE